MEVHTRPGAPAAGKVTVYLKFQEINSRLKLFSTNCRRFGGGGAGGNPLAMNFNFSRFIKLSSGNSISQQTVGLARGVGAEMKRTTVERLALGERDAAIPAIIISLETARNV